MLCKYSNLKCYFVSEWCLAGCFAVCQLFKKYVFGILLSDVCWLSFVGSTLWCVFHTCCLLKLREITSLLLLSQLFNYYYLYCLELLLFRITYFTLQGFLSYIFIVKINV